MYHSVVKEAVTIMTMVAVIAPQPTGVKHHARPELVTEATAVSPGTVTRVLVHFKIDDDWHLYWDGQNDTGQPPRFTWKVPPGWTISEPEFPAPKRNVQPGGIVDYIYEHDLTLRFTVSVPPDAAMGAAQLSASIEWLECSDRCLFGSGTPEGTIAVEAKPATGSLNPAAKPLLDALLPLQLRPFETLKGSSISIQGSAAVIAVPDAVRLEYFAGNASSTPKDAVAGTASDGSSFRVEFATKGEPAIVHGIVAVYRTKQGSPEYYLARAGKPAPSVTEPAGKPIK